MPLPEDPKVVETSTGLVKVLQDIFGSHPGYRPVHAKGVLLSGTFAPTPLASTLTTAPHFNCPSTPILARFSSSTGIPTIPDTDPNGNPHGFALRFILAPTPRRLHTDIISHSTPFFPCRTGPETLEFFTALKTGTAESFLSTHPAAVAFVQAPKPTPTSLAHEKFFSVNAFKLTNSDGKETFIRYRFSPVLGTSYLDENNDNDNQDLPSSQKPVNFLFDELPSLLSNNKSIKFKLLAQIAQDGDITDDATVHWPEAEREIVELGEVELTDIAEAEVGGEEQRRIIFDPVPRGIAGLEASADPLLEVRAGVYLISGRERRGAEVD